MSPSTPDTYDQSTESDLSVRCTVEGENNISGVIPSLPHVKSLIITGVDKVTGPIFFGDWMNLHQHI